MRVKRLGQSKTDRRAEQAGLAGPATREMISERLRVLREYRWSSYGAYAGYGPRPEWLTCAELWRRAGRRGECGTKAYRRYVERCVRQGQEEDLWGRLHAGMALGEAAFVERVRKLVKGDPREQPAVRQWRTPPAFESVVEAMERVKGERWLVFRDRRGDPGRDLVLWLARRRCGLTLRELGAAAGGMDYLAVSKAVARIDQRLHDDRELTRLRESLEYKMSNV